MPSMTSQMMHSARWMSSPSSSAGRAYTMSERSGAVLEVAQLHHTTPCRDHSSGAPQAYPDAP